MDCQPIRLELDDAALALAKQQHVSIVIDSNAHSANELQNIDLGIFQARRGGLEPGDVANTRGADEFLRLLQSKRGSFA